MNPADVDALLAEPPFGHPSRGNLVSLLNALTAHHRKKSRDYGKIVDLLFERSGEAATLADVPYLPVGVFKTHELRSIDRTEIFKTLMSSGTTSPRVSRIVLDRETAARQTRALAAVMMSVLGPQRLPMILIDNASAVTDRQRYSARGAGIVGMSTFGRDHFHALDAEMRLDRDGLHRFLNKHKGGPIVLFGFTFLAWRYFLQALEPGEVDLSLGILIHGGGWKKLAEEAVARDEFRRMFKMRTGLTRIHDYYGMVEQIGSVHLECEEGFLHTPAFSEVIVRNPVTWMPAATGESGVLQVLSALPTSYPGHSLLTEDLGTIAGSDGCRCGRRGTYFVISGRVPATEPRGCSDTFVAPIREAT